MMVVGVGVGLTGEGIVVQVLGWLAAVVAGVIVVLVVNWVSSGRKIRRQERRAIIGGIAGTEGVLTLALVGASISLVGVSVVLYVMAVLCAALGVIYGLDRIKKWWDLEFCGYGVMTWPVDAGVVSKQVLGARLEALLAEGEDMVRSADGSRFSMGGGYHLGNILVWSQDDEGAAVSCGLLYPGRAAKGPRNEQMLARVLPDG
jgi:hypothetical protein